MKKFSAPKIKRLSCVTLIVTGWSFIFPVIIITLEVSSLLKEFHWEGSPPLYAVADRLFSIDYTKFFVI